ncbi:hypothetical protein O3M35_011871 [Rhynocoris fuscipes]|uniref:Uncharacterized protein n=1 Tax=Rhynocoris fuscipes TaxID=488301 RepID=A0AAW1CWT2_9HEMI
MNIKQIELLKNYSVINNSSLQYKKTTTIRRSEEKTEDADLQESLEPPITVLSTAQQSPAIAGLNTSVTTNDFKSEQLNKSAEISAKRKQHNFKDESVQTQFQCNAEQQDDVELLKLGLLLEILNTSEFNTYKALGIKRCDREQTNYENERSFRAFLNEIDEHGEQINEIFSSGKRKLSEKRRFPVLNERGDSKLNEDLLLKGNFESIDLEKANYCSFDAQISGGDYETYKDPLNDKVVTMQANNSQDKRFRKAMQSVISFLVPSTTSTTMKSEQIVEDVSSSVYRGLPAAAAPSPPLVQQTCKPPTTTPPLSLWSKLNPFRLCFSVGDTERQQKAIKSDDRTEDMLKTLFRNEYNCTQYCTMSADEYAGYSSAESQIRMNAERSELSRTVFCKAEYNPTVNYCSVADKEALDIRNNTKNGLKSIINPSINDMYNASYFSNDFQSKYSMIKYPCDGLSYAHCPGGCNLCFPELIKPNIFKTMYYPHY